jgi:PadR family transcriptional regulator PadR
MQVRQLYPCRMSATKIRLTAVIMDVLDVLTNAPSDNPAWGLRLCEQTGYGTSTIYPALDRLMKAGWISDHWEDPPPADRPPRRFYEVTSVGREQYTAALRERDERRARWLRPSPGTAAGAA